MPERPRRGRWVLVLVLVAGLSACSGILGFEEPQHPADSGAPPTAADAETPPVDAPAQPEGDGPPEASDAPVTAFDGATAPDAPFGTDDASVPDAVVVAIVDASIADAAVPVIPDAAMDARLPDAPLAPPPDARPIPDAPLVCPPDCPPCTTIADCAPNEFCDVAGGHICKPKLTDGTSCPVGANEQCLHGHCITEGSISLCCDAGCTQGCKSCLASRTGASDGRCANVVGGMDPKGSCPALECRTGVCDGNGACGLSLDGAPCETGGSCCTGVCVQERSDPANCGMCAQICPVGGGETCASGVCGAADWALWRMPNATADTAKGAPNPMSYHDNHDKTVTDLVTNLMWMQDVTGPVTIDMASTICPGRIAGGYVDWRLPTLIELMSIVDENVIRATDPPPTINTTAFPNTIVGTYLTATAVATSPGSTWAINFANGGTMPVNSGSFYIRCVR